LIGVSGFSRRPTPGEQFSGAGAGFGPVDHAALDRLVAQEDVLRDGELRDERQLLVDDHDARVFAGPDVLELLDLVLINDVAGVAAVGVHAGEDLHQGGLSGPVFPADRVDLAGLHPEADIGQGFNTREFLGDGTHLQKNRLALRVEGRHVPLRLQCIDFVVFPAIRRAV
jgi:hypothetical protein